MQSVYVRPVPQYAPQYLDLSKKTNPSSLFVQAEDFGKQVVGKRTSGTLMERLQDSKLKRLIQEDSDRVKAKMIEDLYTNRTNSSNENQSPDQGNVLGGSGKNPYRDPVEPAPPTVPMNSNNYDDDSVNTKELIAGLKKENSEKLQELQVAMKEQAGYYDEMNKQEQRAYEQKMKDFARYYNEQLQEHIYEIQRLSAQNQLTSERAMMQLQQVRQEQQEQLMQFQQQFQNQEQKMLEFKTQVQANENEAEMANVVREQEMEQRFSNRETLLLETARQYIQNMENANQNQIATMKAKSLQDYMAYVQREKAAFTEIFAKLGIYGVDFENAQQVVEAIARATSQQKRPRINDMAVPMFVDNSQILPPANVPRIENPVFDRTAAEENSLVIQRGPATANNQVVGRPNNSKGKGKVKQEVKRIEQKNEIIYEPIPTEAKRVTPRKRDQPDNRRPSKRAQTDFVKVPQFPS